MAIQAHAVQRTAAPSVHLTSKPANIKEHVLATPVAHAEAHAARAELRDFGRGGGSRFPRGPEPRFPREPHFPRGPRLPIPIPIPVPVPSPLQTYHKCFAGEVLTNPVQVRDGYGRAWCGDAYSYEYPDSTPYPYSAP